MRMRTIFAAAMAASLGLGGAALAAENGKAKAKGQAHSSAIEHSNKGGALKGLDRADQAAGQHGDAGRDNAAARQAKHK